VNHEIMALMEQHGEGMWQYVAILTLCSVRLFVILSFLPPFSTLRLPRLLTKALAIIVSLPIILTPEFTFQPPLINWQETLWLLAAKEVVLGLGMALILGLPFWAAEAAGAIIDVQRGAGFSETANSFTNDQTTVMGILMWLFMMVVFVKTGGLVSLIQLLYGSFEVWPLVDLTPNFSMAPNFLLDLLNLLVFTAVLVAMPLIILMLLADVTLFYISVFVPQLNVQSISMPVKSGFCCFFLTLYAVSVPRHIFAQIDIQTLLEAVHN